MINDLGPVVVVPVWPMAVCLFTGAAISAFFFGPAPVLLAIAGCVVTAAILVEAEKTLVMVC